VKTPIGGREIKMEAACYKLNKVCGNHPDRVLPLIKNDSASEYTASIETPSDNG
jgi:hypothetical protein